MSKRIQSKCMAIILTLTMTACFLSAMPQTAQATSTITVTLTTATSDYPSRSATYLDSGLTVSSDDNLTGGTININGFVSGDQLYYTNSGGITGSYNQNNGVLTITGTASAAAYQTFLRNIQFYTTSTSGTRTLEIVLSNTSSNAMYYSGTGHFYQYISSGLSWTQAKAAANNATYPGVTGNGYLVTITSTGENAFISQKLGNDTWIGASDAASEGTSEGNWIWVGGPEAGRSINDYYTNWAGSEPNNMGGENYAEIYVANGTWNDLNGTQGYGYVIEYGYQYYSLNQSGSASKAITIVTTPTISSVSPNCGPIAGGTTVTITGTGFTGATAVQFGGTNATSYTVNSSTQITATTPANSEGTVDVTVATAAGTSSTSSADRFTYDNTPPSVTISSSAANPTNASPIPFSITFSESVTGFILSDISVGNGTASNFSGSGANYTVNITPTTDGSVTVDIAAGAAQDAAGNLSTIATQSSRTFDSTPPDAPVMANTITLTSNTKPTWTWSTGGGGNGTYRYKLDNSDLTSGATSGAVTSYTPASGLADGTHTLYVEERDAADNWSSSSSYTITVDTTPPTVAGVSNNTAYTASVTPTFTEGTATLQKGSEASIVYTSDTPISADGNYVLTVTDTAGNSRIVNFIIDTIAPTVTAINRQDPSEQATNVTTVKYTVSFSEAVNGVSKDDFSLTATGTATGSIASVSAASGTDFTVTVNSASGDGTLRLDLSSSGTGITDIAGNLIATGFTSGQSYSIDTIAPTVGSVAVPTNGTYKTGDHLNFTVNFDEAVTVSTTVGTPYITLNIGGTTVHANYLSGSGSTAITFRYTIAAGNSDANGIDIGAMSLNGGTILDAVGNAANITLNSIGSTTAVLVDAVAPTVFSVGVPANGTYKTGDDLNFTVTFDEAVEVSTTGGTPYITLNIGGTTVHANYQSGNGTSTISFRYTLVDGDMDADGIALGNNITLNGGTIQDAAGNAANITLNSVGSTAAVLVDAVAPTVSSVGVPANGTYPAGSYLDFTVQFSEAVSVSTAAGTPDISLTVGSSATKIAYLNGSGTSAITFRYTVKDGDMDTDGIALGNTITLNGGTITDAAGNPATLALNSVASTTAIMVDGVAPAIASATLDNNNTYVDITFAEGVYGAADGNTALSANKFALTFTQNGGAATNVVIRSVKKNDNTAENLASALTGGEMTVRVFLTITGTPSGVETIAIKPTNSTAVYDKAGNTMAANQTTGILTLKDQVAPAAGASGTITPSKIEPRTMNLSWAAADDDATTKADLQYQVVTSLTNNIATLADAESNGTIVQDWTANLTSINIALLNPATTYYFTVIVKDAAGNKSMYTLLSQKTAAIRSHSSSGVKIVVNGDAHSAGTTVTTTDTDGRTVTTVTIDTNKLNELLSQEKDYPTVIIPITNNPDTAAGILTGQMVKSMEEKSATLVMETGSVTYTLPASEINISAVSQQLGQNVSLADITVQVTIAEPADTLVTVVQNAAADGGYAITVPPVEFTVTCTSQNTTVEVSAFNAYIERRIAIPDGVDPEKITTGIVVKPDGTVYHVPTKITLIDGKYYAVINSLTNSAYAVIWHPVGFTDVENHWAKEAVNNMGSRMIVTGVGNNCYNPDQDITRAEFAAIIVRALGLAPGTGKINFRDVTATDWYYPYIQTAYAYGILSGYTDTTFAPNETITREQAMAMIAGAMQLTGLDTSLSDSEMGALFASYNDINSASGYARASIAACLKNGIISGRGEQSIAPQANITRAEVAVIIQRLLQQSDLI